MALDPGFKLSIEPASDSRTPLVRFRGTLKNIVADERANDRGSYVVGKFDFTDVVVLESTEPYPFPIATIELPYNPKIGTRWNVFAISANKILGTNDINLLQNKDQEWYYGPCKIRGPLYNEDGTEKIGKNGRPEWGDVATSGWQVVSVEGFSNSNGTSSGINLTDLIIDMVNGKTDKEFYAEFFTDPTIKKAPGYLDASEAASERKLLVSIAGAGRIVQNSEGVWSKVD